jgi:hypothetical protein
MGRPSKFKPEFVMQVQKLCALGATDTEIADFFGVSTLTINRWKFLHSDFGFAIKTAKEIADSRVERSLYARATGYEHADTDVRVIQNAVVMTPIRKYYPPDTAACIFWLKNRKPDFWRDRYEQPQTDLHEAAQLAQDVMAKLMATTP